MLLYAVAALAVLPAALYQRPRWRYVAIPTALGGVFFHFVAFVEAMAAAHHALPVDTHESMSLLGLLLAAAFLGLAVRFKTVAFGIFLLPMAVLVSMAPAFRPGAEMISYPYLGSGWWLFLHVALLLAAYAALLVSLMASVLYLLGERGLKQKRLPSERGWLPPLETMDAVALKALLWGLPCMTAGLLIGSVVAMQTVGPAFFADPKVLLSFLLWLAYMLMIWIRKHSGLRGRRAVYLSSLALFFVLAVWAANQLSVVHRFKAP